MIDNYAWEKFYTAIRGMAASPGNIHRRIADAFATSLTLIHEENLRDDLTDIWDQLRTYRREWDRVQGGPEGSIVAWADGLSVDAATNVAGWIVDSYDRLSASREDDE